MATKIQIRGGTAAQWATVNPILSEREMGIETDTRKFKFGDGATVWNSLGYGIAEISDVVEGLTGEYVNNTDPQNPVIEGIDDAIQAAIDSVTASSLGLGNVDNTSDEDKPVSTAQQTALDLKLDKSKNYIEVACSDETTALTAGTAKITFRMPYAMTVTAVRASLVTAQASGNIFTVDINDSNTSILSTKLTIDNTEKTSTTAATPAVISDANLADDAEITIDIDQIGNGSATGLKVKIYGS